MTCCEPWPFGVWPLPAGEGVGGEAAVHQGDVGQVLGVWQVRVVGPQLSRVQLPLKNTVVSLYNRCLFKNVDRPLPFIFFEVCDKMFNTKKNLWTTTSDQYKFPRNKYSKYNHEQTPVDFSLTLVNKDLH